MEVACDFGVAKTPIRWEVIGPTGEKYHNTREINAILNTYFKGYQLVANA